MLLRLMNFPNPNISSEGAFRNPIFRKLALGSCFNAIGWQGEQVILGLLVYELTGSSAWVGISLALNFAPMLFVGVPAGALADRFDRRSVLIIVEIILAIALALFALLLTIGNIDLTAALVMSVISGVVRAVHHPARLSYAGDIAGKSGLLGALSMLSIVSRLGQLLGALGAGAISESFSMGAAYLVLAFSHILAVICFRGTEANRPGVERQADATAETTRRAIRSYLKLFTTNRLLILLIGLASLVEVFGFSFATAMPEMVVERLQSGVDELGIIHAARNAGGLFGAVLLTLIAFKRIGFWYLLVIIGFGVGLVMLAYATTMFTVLLTISFVALCASSSDILIQSMLQRSVPEELRGRAMGAWVVALGVGPLGHLELGWLISLFGISAALSANGIVMLIVGLFGLLLVRSVKELRLG